MMACGGGKNGNGSHANFAVASSHTVRNRPSATSHGARRRKAGPAAPRKSAPSVPNSASAATTKAAMPSAYVRDQSPRSGHHRHDRPSAIQAIAAATPTPELLSQSPIASAREFDAREPSTEIVSDSEYVDIDLLREFRRIRAWLEDRDRLQIVGVFLELTLQHLADGMMVMGMVTRHRFEI